MANFSGYGLFTPQIKLGLYQFDSNKLVFLITLTVTTPYYAAVALSMRRRAPKKHILLAKN